MAGPTNNRPLVIDAKHEGDMHPMERVIVSGLSLHDIAHADAEACRGRDIRPRYGSVQVAYLRLRRAANRSWAIGRAKSLKFGSGFVNAQAFEW